MQLSKREMLVKRERSADTKAFQFTSPYIIKIVHHDEVQLTRWLDKYADRLTCVYMRRIYLCAYNISFHN